jgi:hypothetical protein
MWLSTLTIKSELLDGHEDEMDLHNDIQTDDTTLNDTASLFRTTRMDVHR